MSYLPTTSSLQQKKPKRTITTTRKRTTVETMHGRSHSILLTTMDACTEGIHCPDSIHCSKKHPCEHGTACPNLTNSQHLKKSYHLCPEGDSCTLLEDKVHCLYFMHVCRDGNCRDKSGSHRDMFRHECKTTDCVRLGDPIHQRRYIHKQCPNFDSAKGSCDCLTSSCQYYRDMFHKDCKKQGNFTLCNKSTLIDHCKTWYYSSGQNADIIGRNAIQEMSPSCQYEFVG